MRNQILFLVTLISFSMHSQNIETDLNEICKKNKLIGLSVYTFSGNKFKSYHLGYRNEAQKLPITKETTYRIASISKAFTSLGLIKLLDKKLLKLDEDISKYLGFKVINPKYPKDKITLRMLLSHTSSIQDGTGYDSFLSNTFSQSPIPSISSVLSVNGDNYSNDTWRNEKPGDFFCYSNLNYGIIGTIIEKISKQRFDVFMKNEVLIPIGISGSYSIEDIDISNLATLYRSENNAWKPQKDDYNGIKPVTSDLSSYIIGDNAVFFGPQGGLRISAIDLLKLLQYIKSDGKTVPNLISKRTLKKMKKVEWAFDNKNGDDYNGFFKKYALGLHTTNGTDSDLMSNPSLFGNFIGHAGDAYGLISDAYFSEKENFGFVIITNGSFDPFIKGKKSSFYEFEESIFKIICEDYINTKI